LDASQLNAVDPNIFREIALELAYDIVIGWDETQSDCCEIHFQRCGLIANFNTATSKAEARVTEGQLVQSDPLASRYQQRISKRLRDALKAQLPQYMVPSAFVVIDEIPLTMQGKVDRGLLPPPPLRPLASGELILPADEMEQLVASVWEDLLDVHPIGATDNFFELGGHSMLAVRMTAEIERRSGHAIPLAALFEEPTVRYLASLLSNPDSRGAKGSLIALGGQSSEGNPLFCIHPAGGTVFCYRPLAERLGAERPVFGLQAVGIDGKDTPHFSLDEMASHYVDAIRAARPHGPYHIAGWSLGGNIAFEVARQLQQTGEPIGVLALFDSGLLSSETTLNEEDFLPMIMALFPGDEHISLDELRQKTREEQVRYFTGRAAQAGIVPAEHEEMGKHIMQVFQANVKAVHEYRPLPFAGTVTLFRPTEQSKTNSLFDDPRLGWQPHCDEVVIQPVPGDHARMLKHPTVEQLASRLQEICRVADNRMLTRQT
jgi:thioesterase domain-containing protein